MKHIHIISPASAIDSQWIKRASLRLEQWGFRVSVAQHAYGNIGRFSATDEERVADLNAAFADPTIDIILCSRGGYGLQRIIDKVVLPQRPKDQWPMLVGFSDIVIVIIPFKRGAPSATSFTALYRYSCTSFVEVQRQ